MQLIKNKTFYSNAKYSKKSLLMDTTQMVLLLPMHVWC